MQEPDLKAGINATIPAPHVSFAASSDSENHTRGPREASSKAIARTALPSIAGVTYMLMGANWLVLGLWQLAWTYLAVAPRDTGTPDYGLTGALNVLASLIDLAIGVFLTRRSKRAYSLGLWIAVLNIVGIVLPPLDLNYFTSFRLVASVAATIILLRSRREFEQVTLAQSAPNPYSATSASNNTGFGQVSERRPMLRPILKGCLWAFLASITSFVAMWIAYLPATLCLIPFDTIPHLDWAATSRMLAVVFFIMTPLAAPVLGLIFGLTGALVGSRLEQRWKRAWSADPSGNAGRALGALFAGGLAGTLLTVLVMAIIGLELMPPTATGPRAKEATSAYSKGAESERMGEYDQAVAYYNTALELDPQYAAAYEHRGYSLYRQGQCGLAIDDYTRFIELKPNLADGYFDRGNAYLQKKDLVQAINDLTRSIELQPKGAAAYRSRGMAFRAQQSTPQAISDFETYLQLAPNASDRAEVEGWLRELR